MTSKASLLSASRVSLGVLLTLTFVGLSPTGLETAEANGDTRTISITNTHVNESITITFKRDGRYDSEALKKLNWFLRDWRKEQETTMDPRLIDLVWEVYRDVGGTEPIHLICGYRSLATNNMLRERSSGVAQHSQHTLGKAMDFFIPGVPLMRVREKGMLRQRGGVGFYPTSGSPFVHLDVGNVRAWPRMTRDQLVRLFPDGNTLHMPADGAPLPGYQATLARLGRDGKSGEPGTTLAFANPFSRDTPGEAGPSTRPVGSGRNILTALFGGADQVEDEATANETATPRRTPVRPAPAATDQTPRRNTVLASLPPAPPIENQSVRAAPPPLPLPRPVELASLVPPPANAAEQPRPGAPIPLPLPRPDDVTASLPSRMTLASAEELPALPPPAVRAMPIDRPADIQSMPQTIQAALPPMPPPRPTGYIATERFGFDGPMSEPIPRSEIERRRAALIALDFSSTGVRPFLNRVPMTRFAALAAPRPVDVVTALGKPMLTTSFGRRSYASADRFAGPAVRPVRVSSL